MKINLSPQRGDGPLTVEKLGDCLTINGEVFDFSSLPEGSTLPVSAIGSAWFRSDVSRTDGEIELTILMPHGPNPQSHVAFPEPILDPPDGLIVFPENFYE